MPNSITWNNARFSYPSLPGGECVAVTKLTSVGVKRLRPPAHGRADYADTILPGLHLRVTDKCHKSWSVVYRINGKQRRMTLGAYPTLDLIDARAAAREALQAVERGEDPIQLRHAGEPAAISTFGAVARSFIERYAKPRLATWAQTQSILERHVLPQWGTRPIADIAKRDVILLLDHVVDGGGSGNRVLSATRRVFNWACERDMLDASPATYIKPPVKEVARDRVLTDDEVVAIWAACGQLGYPMGTFVKMLLLTAQRRTEVATMQWADVDLDAAVWTLPAERAKSGRIHQVPLSPVSMGILGSLPQFSGPYIFTTTSGEKAVAAYSAVKRRVDALAGVADWRLHDLRRTAASGMAKLGTPVNVLSKVLNHVSAGAHGGVTAIYNRYAYENEKREALEAWARYVKELV